MSSISALNNTLTKERTGKDLVFLTVTDYNNLVNALNAKVNRAGDTMLGFLTLNADPTLAMHAATKRYADATAAAAAADAVDDVNDALNTHVAATTAHGSTPANTASRIVQRDANGQFNVGAPTALTHVVRLQDLNGVINNLNAHINMASDPHQAASSVEAVPDMLIIRDENARAEVANPTSALEIVNLQYLNARLGNVAIINPAAPKNGDIQVTGTTIYILASGAWQQVFPPRYQ